MAQQVRSARNTGDVGDAGSVPELGRFLGGINGNPRQRSSLKTPRTEEPGGLGPGGCRESDTTEHKYYLEATYLIS